jgi:predicted transcriptional regulator
VTRRSPVSQGDAREGSGTVRGCKRAVNRRITSADLRRKCGEMGSANITHTARVSREIVMKAATTKSAASVPSDYERWKAEQIQLGLDDIEAGRVHCHDDVMAQARSHVDALSKNLSRSNAKAA